MTTFAGSRFTGFNRLAPTTSVVAPAPATQSAAASAPSQGGFVPQGPAPTISGMFSGLGAAKARLDANYDAIGHYYKILNKSRIDRNRKGEEFACVEQTVIHVLDDNQGRGHRVGEDCTWMQMRKHETFLGNVKAFIAHVLNCPADSVDLAAAEFVFGPDQPLAGTVVEVKSREISTRNNRLIVVTNFIREVPAAELMQVLPQEVKDRFFPGDTLQRIHEQQLRASQQA